MLREAPKDQRVFARRRRRPRGGALAALLLVSAIIALLVYGLVSRGTDDTIDSRLSQGRVSPAPGFDIAVLERGAGGGGGIDRLGRGLVDGRLSLGELRGTPVVLNFWASWCPPCRTEAPRLERAWRTARRGGVAFVGLNMQDVKSDARGFLREFGVSYPTIRDPADDTARRWGVTGLPETFFIRSDGRVVGHVIGAISATRLRDGVRAARTGRPLGALEGGDRRSTR